MRKHVLLMCALFTGIFCQAQLTGTKAIPGDYATLAAAVTALNTQGVGAGGVTFDVAAPQTTNAAYVITATGTAANPIIFEGNGNTITATGGTATTDGVIVLAGSDYVTINNFVISGNNTVEWGIALLKKSATAPFDGCQFNTISNNTITLDKTNVNSRGVYANHHIATSTTTLTTTGTAVGDANSNNAVFNNTISSVYVPILFNGINSTANYDQNNNFGGGGANTLTDFGGGTSTVYGIRAIYYNGITITSNSIDLPAGTTTTAYGIMLSTGAGAINITNNNLVLVSSATTSSAYGINSDGTGSTVTISGNTISLTNSTSTSGTFYGIYQSTTPNAVVMSANTLLNSVHGGTGTMYGIYNSGATTSSTMNGNNVSDNSKASTGTFYTFYHGSSANLTMDGNTISNNARTGASGTMYCLHVGTATATVTNNQIYGNNASATSGTSSTAIYSLYSASSPASETFTGNQIHDQSISGTSTSTSSLVYGIYSNPVAGTVKNYTNNTIYSLSTHIGTAAGIYTLTGNTVGISRNRIYNISTAGAAGLAYGVYLSTGTTITVANNLIGDIKAPASSLTAPAPSVSGVYVNGPSIANIYYNTIYLNATSTGTNFGSAAVYASTTPTVTLRNNILINTSTPAGTGKTVAHQRSSATLTSYGSASDNNLLYVGATSASKVLYYDGTNSDATIAAYKTRMSTRELGSVSENLVPAFISTNGADAGFLHITAGTATQAESGAVNIAGITNDYDDQVRAGNTGYAGTGTAPDMGADEFVGANPAPSISNITATPTGVQCAATPRTITATVAQGASAVTTVQLSYSFNGGAVTTVAMTNTSGNTWSATIPAATPANAQVTYSIVATDANGLQTVGNGATYSDAPFTGVTIAATAQQATLCEGGSTALSAALSRNATVATGAGLTTSSGVGASPFYHTWGGQKVQYILTAAELTAMGLSAGNITSIGVDITSLGTANLAGFAISMGHTTQNSFATANTIATVATVYTPAGGTQTLVAGTNTFTLTTPFTWDGTSNVIVQFCYSNNNTGGTSSTVRVDAASANQTVYIYADSQTPATVCGATTTIPASGSSGTTATRPRFLITGNVAPAATFTWSVNGTTVGTGASINVTPAATTSYTVTATNANNCAITSSPVTVTVIPVPAAPSAVNSIQCGIGIPTATVTGTGTLKWYSAATGGTLLQTGGSTYASSINATTTFYVAANNGTCDGPRTAVTATVTQPDVVTAAANAATICPNTSVVLTATNTGSTNNYTYSWSSTANSGATTPVAGNPVTITPTAAGTYVYTVTANDATAGCTTTATVSVTVTVPPTLNAAVATPSVSCAGGNVALSVTTPVIAAGQATIGTGTLQNVASSTGSTAYPNPFGAYYFGAKNQMLITAAELQAAGLRAGNITSIAFDVATPKATALENFSVQLGHTSLTALSTFQTGLTTVVPSTSYNATSAAGYAANTITFSTPFNWDGTSNLIVQTCFNNTDDSASHAVLNQSATSYVSTLVYRADAATVCASTTTTYTYSQRPNMRFGGQLVTNGAGTLTYVWTPGNLAGNTVAVAPTVTTTYTVKATDPVSGCFSTSDVTVNVVPVAVTVTASESQICNGRTVTLTAVEAGGAPFTYSWKDASNTVVGTTRSVTLTPAATTTYTVTITDACGNTASSPVTITVLAPAVVSNTPATRCGLGTVALQATGEPGATLNWYTTATGGPVAGTGTSFTTPSINATTTFYVAAVNGGSNLNVGRLAPQAGSATTGLAGYGEEFTITKATTLNSVEVISTTGTSMTISLYNAAGTTQLQTTGARTVPTNATTAVTLGWTLAPGTYRLVVSAMTGDFIRENSLTTYPIDLGGVGQINGFHSSLTGTLTTTASYYFFYKWNMFIPCEGPRTPVVATVTTPPATTVTASSTSICESSSTVLSVSSPNSGYTYTWTPGNQTGASITVTPAATTKYYVLATDNSGGASNGCSKLDSLTVSVSYPFQADATSAASAVCAGSSTQLNVAVQSRQDAIRITEVMINRGGTGSTASIPAYSPTAANDVVEVSNISNQPVNVAGMTLEVWTGTAVNRSFTFPAGTVLPAQSISLVHIGTGTDDVTNRYFNTGGTTDNITSAQAVGFLLKASNRIVDAVGLNSYAFPAASAVTAANWSGNIASTSGIAGVTRTSASDNNTAADWANATAANPQTIGAFNTAAGYQYTPIGPITYQWTPAATLSDATIANPVATPVANTEYIVTITNTTSGCVVKDTVVVNVTPLPVASTTLGNRNACAGDAITFTTTAANVTAYQWRKDGTPIPGATTNTYTIAAVNATTTGFYELFATNGTCGPVRIDSARVFLTQFNGTPSVNANFACANTAFTFNNGVTVANGTVTNTTWNFGDGNTVVSSAATLTHTYTAAGTYSVTLTVQTDNGCSQVFTFQVVVNPATAIATQPLAQTTCPGSPVSFTVTATGSGLSYQWRKDGNPITGATSATYTIASASAADAGTYSVVVTGDCGSATSGGAALSLNAANTWNGTVSTDWNNAANWCGGVPTANSNITIPAGVANMPAISNAASVGNLTIATGATVTVATGGTLEVYGNLQINGTFNALAGTVAFRGTAAQTTSGFDAGTVTFNGAGGVTLLGDVEASTTNFTLGNVTLGDFSLETENTTGGGTGSYAVTNGLGTLRLRNVGTTAKTAPVGPNAASYNPVTLANGGGRDFRISVAVGINPTIAWPANAVNRTWTINPNGGSATSATVTFGYADAHGNSAFNTAQNMEIGSHNGTAWTIVSPNGGVAATGTAAGRSVTTTTNAFGAMVVGNTGSILLVTAAPTLDADVTSVQLLPTVVENSSLLRIQVRRTMSSDWVITDARGSVVRRLKLQLTPGTNDLRLHVTGLASGVYFLKGSSAKGSLGTIRFVKQ
ncbi:MAG: PKD domain-containing protein [Chitinophagaceae bacterium]|nr:MAG: PKD domain-containing protein [Chitinophagaceae bacterium]